MDDTANPFEEIFKARWFWVSAAILAAAVVGLTIAFYLRHPERSPFTDFAKPFDLPATNGHVPGPSAPVGADFLGGEETG